MKDYLNLGCGQSYHVDWTNVDFISTNEYVLQHDLLNGIPYRNNTFKVVYHSHVLEHFSRVDGEQFMKECYRVLQPGGRIRIAVPDLQRIAEEYLEKLSKALEGHQNAVWDYEWIKLELYDQTVRNKSGGEMRNYLFNQILWNEDYVYSRIGLEGKYIRESYLQQQQQKVSDRHFKKGSFKIGKYLSWSNYKRKLKQFILSDSEKKALEIGLFRLSGEIHQWMYDEFSLKKLLADAGFKEAKVCTADESSIENWSDYQLDTVDGIIRKPDSIYIEAIKI